METQISKLSKKPPNERRFSSKRLHTIRFLFTNRAFTVIHVYSYYIILYRINRALLQFHQDKMHPYQLYPCTPRHTKSKKSNSRVNNAGLFGTVPVPVNNLR